MLAAMTPNILERLNGAAAINPADSLRGIAEATGHLRMLYFDLEGEQRKMLRENIWSLEHHALNLSRTLLGTPDSELLARVLENTISARECLNAAPLKAAAPSPASGRHLSPQTGWTTPQTAEYLGITANYVRDYAGRGLLHPEKHYHGENENRPYLLFDPAEVKAFGEKRKTKR